MNEEEGRDHTTGSRMRNLKAVMVVHPINFLLSSPLMSMKGLLPLLVCLLCVRHGSCSTHPQDGISFLLCILSIISYLIMLVTLSIRKHVDFDCKNLCSCGLTMIPEHGQFRLSSLYLLNGRTHLQAGAIQMIPVVITGKESPARIQG